MATLHQIHGGLHLPRQAGAVINSTSSALPLPQQLIYPLSSHIGTPARPTVRVGQRVRRGDVIAMPSSYVSQTIHAALGGIVIDIDSHPVVGGSGKDRCIIIDVDENAGVADTMRPLNPHAASIEALQSRIVDAGIIGMGGAGFPSHVKLREGIAAQHDGTVDLLIINGVECEPLISSDDSLMRERAVDVIEGTRVLMRALAAERCIIAIEVDMEQALAAIRGAVDTSIEVIAVPEIYPAGGEKQLIRMLTGAEVPTHGLPIDVGVVMHNVATAVAVGDAVLRGMPLLERVVTVAGAVNRPTNLRVPLGTPMQHVLDFCGGISSDCYVIAGGPMMGARVENVAAPIIKTTNALVVMRESLASPSMPCVRCGDCVDVCPVQLQPQALYEFSRTEDWDAAQDYHLFDCIECGACAYVCPSRIALVPEYRKAKASIARFDAGRERAMTLRLRYLAHQARVAVMASEAPADDDGDERDYVSLPPHAMDKSAMQAEIAAAIARVKAKRDATADVKSAKGDESDVNNSISSTPDGKQ